MSDEAKVTTKVTVKPIKPGYKTSEFWTALTTMIALMLPGVIAAVNNQPWAAGVLGLLGTIMPGLYIWGRALLKLEREKKTDIIPDHVEDTIEQVLDFLENLKKAAMVMPGNSILVMPDIDENDLGEIKTPTAAGKNAPTKKDTVWDYSESDTPPNDYATPPVGEAHFSHKIRLKKNPLIAISNMGNNALKQALADAGVTVPLVVKRETMIALMGTNGLITENMELPTAEAEGEK